MPTAEAAPKGIVIATGRPELPFGGRARQDCPYAITPVLLPNGREGFRIGVGGLIYAERAAAVGHATRLERAATRRWLDAVRVDAAGMSDDYAATNRMMGR